MAVPKLSRIQKRFQDRANGINNLPIFLTSPKQGTSHGKTQLSSIDIKDKEPEGTHIVFMGVRDFRSYDKTDALVISITNPEDSPLEPNDKARAWLGLSFDPVFAPSNWINASHVAQIVQLLQNNQDAKRLIVHCGMGEQRSRGIALGINRAISEALQSSGEEKSLAYHYSKGQWHLQHAFTSEQGCDRAFYVSYRGVDKAIDSGAIKSFGDISLVKDESPS